MKSSTLQYRLVSAVLLILSTSIYSKPNVNSRTGKDFGLALPAFLLGNANNAINNGNLPNVNTNPTTGGGGLSNQNSNTNFGGNLFRQVTITRTVLQTVATVTVPVFRTCTTSAMNLVSCMGRRRRSVSEKFHVVTITPSEVMRILQTTEAFQLPTNGSGNWFTKNQSYEVIPDGPILYASPDLTTVGDALRFENVATTELGGDVFSRTEFSNQARINLGGSFITVTRTVPVTAVVNSTVTAGVGANVLVVLTVSYLGCAPPVLPVTGTPC